jgi:O-antigen/teichoic acid export membrane protein
VNGGALGAPLLRHLAFSGLGTVARLASALVSFSVTARCLGPEPFGVLMGALSLALVLALPSNFGLHIRVVRDVATDPERVGAIVSEAVSAKALAAGLSTLAALGVALAMPPDAALLLLAMYAAMLAEAHTEFQVACLRALGRFGADARMSVHAGWLYALAVGVTAAATASVAAVAAAFVVSRGVMAAACAVELRRHMPPMRWLGLAAAWHRLRTSTAYAFDHALTALFGQVDGVVLNHLLGPVAVGVHQAGMRVFMAAAQAGPVLANVFLPRVSAALAAQGADAAARRRSELARMQLTFVAVGAAVGAGLVLGARPLVMVAFGPRFEALVALMPWFGLLFQVRFAAIAWGVTLTSAGDQAFRARASLAHWLLIGALAWAWVPAHGPAGWLMALVAGNAALGAMYLVRVLRGIATPDTWRIAAVSWALLLPHARWLAP